MNAELNSCGSNNHHPHPSGINGACSAPKNEAPLAQRSIPVLPGNRFVVCDGMNLLRMRGRACPKLEILVTILDRVSERAPDLLCIFDANVLHTLRCHQSPQHAELLVDLIERQPDFFVQVTGGTCADDVILGEAEDRDALIVSNDAFKHSDQRKHFTWLDNGDRVIHANIVRQRIHFDGVRLPVCRNVPDTMSRLERRLSKIG